MVKVYVLYSIFLHCSFQVQIGTTKSSRFYVGKLIYEETLWDHPPAKIGFIAVIVFVVLVVISIIAVAVCRKKAKISNSLPTVNQPPDRLPENYLHPVN